jgi:nucleoside-diphosphate-sugar epimerase
LLVTGAGGRLGRLLREVWSRELPPGISPLWSPRRAGRPGDLIWDFDAPPPDLPPGAVILHLAGVTSGTVDQLGQNILMAERLGRAARVAGAMRVLCASTVAVYRPGPLPLTEATPPDPQSPYGASKWAAEQALAAELAGSGVGLTCLRIANVAGADALLGGAAGSGHAVVLDPVPGQGFGPERSYIGPQSLARCLADLAERGDLPAVLNLAQPGVVAMGRLLTAAGLDWRFGPPRAGVVPRVVVDTGRLDGLVALDRASPEGIVAELRAVEAFWP